MSPSGKLFFIPCFYVFFPYILLLEVKFLASLRGNSLTKEIILFRLTKLFRTFAPQKREHKVWKNILRERLITTALPYANRLVHIGHLAGVYVPADIYARYLRLKGEEVLMIGGSDEHGVPITLRAKKEGSRRRMWWIVTTVLSRNRSRSSVSRLISIHVLLPLRIIRWPRVFPYIV